MASLVRLAVTLALVSASCFPLYSLVSAVQQAQRPVIVEVR